MPGRVRSEIVTTGHVLWNRARRKLFREEFRPTRRAFYDELWQDVARTLGIEYVDLGEGFAELRDGESSMRVYGYYVSVDDPVTFELAGHKSVAEGILRDAGIPTPHQVVVGPSDLGPALALLARFHRVVVKPESQTGAGEGVMTHVTTERHLRRAVPEVAGVGGGAAVVEEHVAGDSYRLLYLDGELLDVVMRRPARVVGDGRHRVRQLVRAENRRRRSLGDRSTGPLPVGFELRTTLEAQGRSGRSVPAPGEAVLVSGRSNTGDSTVSRSVLRECGDEVRATGARAAEALGVRLAGVDIVTSDLSRPLEATGGVVNEVNTTPGLHWHYLVADDSPVVPVAQLIAARLLGIPGPASSPAPDDR